MKHFRHLLCTTFACALSAQQTWKVVCDGSYGAHFTDLPAAVNAAAPGDTILACVPALYCPTQLTAPTINKALRIVGLHLGAVPGNPDPSIAPILGTLAINGIHAGSTLTLSNFVQGTYVPNAPGLSITNCAGKVVIENYVLNTLGIPGYVLSIANCNDVVVRGCSIGLAGSPMTITNSNVLFTTTAISYPGPFPFGGGYTQTTEAIRATNSTLTFVGCDVRGVDQQQQPLLAGREAFVITNSNVILAAANYVAGGRFPGGPPYSYTYAWSMPLGIPNNTSTVVRDVRTTLRTLNPLQPAPIIANTNATYHSWVIAGEPYGVTVAGPQNGFALLMFGDLTPTPTPTPFGSLDLDPLNVQFVDVVPITASTARYSWVFNCPTSAPNGVPFAFQSLTLAPDGSLGLTLPSPLTVAWQHGRLP